ncbi:hypothetical protein [Pseudolactococcus insecticola]|uniref:Uncharacterized protein n=1 Tax=Pseudolactococcus insecticola TaxID=2709158 RepID=A0A6A0BAD7_9LACT|nr:hypothetical protein [Lactococcus insecticola]GFH41421.1 hypothetical protein Hs20B_18190 [Lactococcus insecticola]
MVKSIQKQMEELKENYRKQQTEKVVDESLNEMKTEEIITKDEIEDTPSKNESKKSKRKEVKEISEDELEVKSVEEVEEQQEEEIIPENKPAVKINTTSLTATTNQEYLKKIIDKQATFEGINEEIRIISEKNSEYINELATEQTNYEKQLAIASETIPQDFKDLFKLSGGTNTHPGLKLIKLAERTNINELQLFKIKIERLNIEIEKNNIQLELKVEELQKVFMK